MELGPNGPIERERLPWGPTLDQRQRMEVARLGAAAERRAYGSLQHQPHAESFRELLEISRDPLVWGVVLGGALADLEMGFGAGLALVVTWARAAGADEDAAEMHRVWRLARPLAMRPSRPGGAS